MVSKKKIVKTEISGYFQVRGKSKRHPFVIDKQGCILHITQSEILAYLNRYLGVEVKRAKALKYAFVIEDDLR